MCATEAAHLGLLGSAWVAPSVQACLQASIECSVATRHACLHAANVQSISRCAITTAHGCTCSGLRCHPLQCVVVSNYTEALDVLKIMADRNKVIAMVGLEVQPSACTALP